MIFFTHQLSFSLFYQVPCCKQPTTSKICQSSSSALLLFVFFFVNWVFVSIGRLFFKFKIKKKNSYLFAKQNANQAPVLYIALTHSTYTHTQAKMLSMKSNQIVGFVILKFKKKHTTTCKQNQENQKTFFFSSNESLTQARTHLIHNRKKQLDYIS
jgi:hypothetical protein